MSNSYFCSPQKIRIDSTLAIQNITFMSECHCDRSICKRDWKWIFFLLQITRPICEHAVYEWDAALAKLHYARACRDASLAGRLFAEFHAPTYYVCSRTLDSIYITCGSVPVLDQATTELFPATKLSLLLGFRASLWSQHSINEMTTLDANSSVSRDLIIFITLKLWPTQAGDSKAGTSEKSEPETEHSDSETVPSEEDELDNINMMSDIKFEFRLDDDWELFEEKLTCYMLTRNVTDEKIKVATLVTKLSTDAHALLKQLTAPAKITDKKYDDLTDLMTKQLKPKPSEAMERLCGLSDTDTKIKLFEEKDLTLAKALEVSIARESAVKNATSTSNALDSKVSKSNMYYTQSNPQQGSQGHATKNGAAHSKRQQQQQRPRQQQQKQKQRGSDSKIGLKAYDGHPLTPIGELCNLTAVFKNKTISSSCYVMPGPGPALVGRKWLTQFGVWPLILPEVHSIKEIVSRENLCDYIRNKYKVLFDDSPGMYNKSLTKIHMRDDVRPIALKCRHVALALKPLVEKEIEKLVSLKHLKPVQVSEWATPIVPVLKGNGEIRICGDFKLTLNPNIIIDKYPLHSIDDIFAKLQGGVHFSELDLKHAYMQFPVDEESSNLLTIVTHKGLYKYTKIPEGVSPAPADVQRKMDECLLGVDGAIAYLDNIYVTGKTEAEHMRNLEMVCEKLAECNLRLNLKKCHFMIPRLEVLGYVIDATGLHKSKSKVQAMVDAPRPSNTKELSSFLGLVNFYARFLENRSTKLKPLYDLLNGDIWIPSREDHRYFSGNFRQNLQKIYKFISKRNGFEKEIPRTKGYASFVENRMKPFRQLLFEHTHTHALVAQHRTAKRRVALAFKVREVYRELGEKRLNSGQTAAVVTHAQSYWMYATTGNSNSSFKWSYSCRRARPDSTSDSSSGASSTVLYSLLLYLLYTRSTIVLLQLLLQLLSRTMRRGTRLLCGGLPARLSASY
ncbi:unnamed protein product [Trichogramma brassicae]|uniref:Reverse transcriptase domain-containing protein n=1 Tax=Trichogramma brassicae TaxID=86971 RepID=A0A6H5IFA9_9HYME|nr:unnamed protein product [Trichogramma brassicae]